MATFFFNGFRSSPLKYIPFRIYTKRTVNFIKKHGTLVCAVSGTVASVYALTLRRVVRAEARDRESVLWDHQRGMDPVWTSVSAKDNPHRRYTQTTFIYSFSWLENLAGFTAIISMILLLVSQVPILPTVYATYFRWSSLLIVPLTYYGREVLVSWMGNVLHRNIRRRRIWTRPKRIILIRHGESMANIDPTLYQSTPDNQIPLSDKGNTQALIAGKDLRKIIGNESVRFYVSPYKRTKETWQRIIEGGQWGPNDYTAREEPRLREQDWGNFQEPAHMDKVDKDRRRFGTFYYRMPNGESGSDVFDRVTSVWDTMYREFDDRTSQNYVLVTHGLTIRLFLMRYYQWTVEQFHELWNPGNCQFAVMELQDDAKYRLWTKEDWENIAKNSNEKNESVIKVTPLLNDNE